MIRKVITKCKSHINRNKLPFDQNKQVKLDTISKTLLCPQKQKQKKELI